jgi:hypothetical protein
MKKFTLACVLALSLGVASCDYLGGGGEPGENPIATQLLAAIAQGCNFIPTDGTISSLISAWNLEAGAAAAIIEQVAETVCTAVETRASAETGWKVTAPDGTEVEIEGQFATPPPQ